MPAGFLAKMLPKAGCVLCQSGLADTLLQWLPFSFCLQPGPLVEPRLMLAQARLPANGRMAKHSPFLLNLFIARSHSGRSCLSGLPRWHRGGPGALTPRCSLWFLSALASVVSFIQTRCQKDDTVQGAKGQTGYRGLCSRAIRA